MRRHQPAESGAADRRRPRRVLTAVASATVALFVGAGSVAATTPAPAGGGEPVRIRFAPGTDNDTVHGTVSAGATDRYLLWAEAGQWMTLDISPGTVFTVWTPSGAFWSPGGTPSWQGGLPETGDYYIEVASVGGTTSYAMPVWIQWPPPVERIEFATGTDNTTVRGVAHYPTPNRYVLRARAGQTMSVDISTTRGLAMFTIWTPEGRQLSGPGVTSFRGELPESGDFHIEVASDDLDAHFSMPIRITGSGDPATGAPSGATTTRRINFAPGTAGAAVEGHLVADDVHRYLLRASGGQWMEVSLSASATAAAFEVIAPNGQTLSGPGWTTWGGELPSDGDYVVVVSSSAASSYLLGVVIVG